MADDVKQVIVMRKDLNMRKGKMVAQGAHASMAVFLNNSHIEGMDSLVMPLTKPMKAWLEGRFTKICVGVDSVEHLLLTYDKAVREKLPCSLIKDAGLTEFGGEPTYTAVAIGPAEAADIDKITGELKLL